jgi:4a-hydroxytetrahydrobiopterin dehydratase
MAGKLDEIERAAALEGLTNWTLGADQNIVRSFRFKSFSEAFGFMMRVALLAEKADHHPDWSNSYGKVEISLSTHDAGGITQKDIDLAQKIDALLD